ncbi:hypothetical protein CBR_g32717 [Chara braunii]|uniref:CCHC-type domain-containing protein n=1 Tax=Chara braunii TaxID=69332 RepID=A0A388LHK3_CHABU|nr:hypothetical protein CBR_g32717 [Chara braunii]|eukprot:GBG81725.1 hypothetical protein CBR_g32717 [Chara braunii]
MLRVFACDDLIPTIEGLRQVSRGEQESLVMFTRRFKRLSQPLVDRGMLSEVDRCVMFMLHLPEEKRKEVLERVPRDSTSFEKVAEVVFTGGGVDVREYMKKSLDLALQSVRTQRNDGPREGDRPPLGQSGPRWGGGPTSWRNESGEGNQGNWSNDHEVGGNRGSEWRGSHWKDARDGRWEDPPQPKATGPRPEGNQARVPPPPSSSTGMGTTSQGGPRPNNPQPQSGCVYCNEERHIKRECPYLTEALRLGVVKLNENKWVVRGDDGEAVSFYPSMKINVDERITLQEARLGKKTEVGGTASSSRVQVTESPGGVAIREPQVFSIKLVETKPKEEGPCLRVRTQVGAGSSKSKDVPAVEGGKVRTTSNRWSMRKPCRKGKEKNLRHQNLRGKEVQRSSR